MVMGDVKADKPAKTILFKDGAQVQFYLNEHKRAAKGKKHIFLSNPEVKFDVSPVTPALTCPPCSWNGDSPPSAPSVA